MNRSKRISAAAILVAGLATSASAQTAPQESPPKVLYDSGDTRPITDFLAGPNSSPPPETPPPNLNGAFPVETPSMGLGRFRSAPWPDETRWRGAPLFLIGADQHSLAWLNARRAHLKEIGAAGLLVDALSETDLITARSVAPDLQIIAASGEDIANHTGLRLYPALITREGIEQ